MISSSQRPLPDNTQHSQQTNTHAPGGIRTHDLSRRAAADLRLRPRGHWDRRAYGLVSNNYHCTSQYVSSCEPVLCKSCPFECLFGERGTALPASAMRSPLPYVDMRCALTGKLITISYTTLPACSSPCCDTMSALNYLRN